MKKLICVLASVILVFAGFCNITQVEAGRGARPNEVQTARQQKSRRAQNQERSRQGRLSEAQKNRSTNKTSKQDKMQARNLKRLQKSDD